MSGGGRAPEHRAAGTEIRRRAARARSAEDPATVARERAWPVPRQLRAAVRHFTGRAAELDALTRLVEDPGGMVVSAIVGTAGVGKTALAVHWAHGVAHRFADGQLYIDLRGFDPAAVPVAPGEALRGFLAALGIRPQRLPDGVDNQASLYRSLLTDMRVLVVLDNARDARQVRPLLPGSAGCMVVVTSRTQLTELVVSESAPHLTLQVLDRRDAWDLLAHRLGAQRLAAEPGAADEIIERCAGLPLALAIVAARAAAHPDFALADLAGQLRSDRPSVLSALDRSGPSVGVRAAFAWSYDQLTVEAAGLFRLLGLHPGPDLTRPAAASLAGMPTPRTGALLEELTSAHLVTERRPGRYTLHDLVRAYAVELVAARDSAAQRQVARQGMLDHYLHTADVAALLLNPHRDAIGLAHPSPGVALAEIADAAQAMAWFTAEHTVLLGALDRAASTGFDAHVWQLAWTLADYLDRRGHWPDWAATQRTALAAARRLADPLAQAHVHRSLARAYVRLGRRAEARAHYGTALRLYRELGENTGQARTHLGIAGMLEQEGRYRQAIGHTQSALAHFRSARHQAGQARALNGIGWMHAQLGDYGQSLRHCERALALLQETGDPAAEAPTWDSLGYAHHHLGHHRQAIECYQQALDRYRSLGNRYHQTVVLDHLGDVHQGARDPASAREAWRQALVILDDLGHADAERLRGKLRDVH